MSTNAEQSSGDNQNGETNVGALTSVGRRRRRPRIISQSISPPSFISFAREEVSVARDYNHRASATSDDWRDSNNSTPGAQSNESNSNIDDNGDTLWSNGTYSAHPRQENEVDEPPVEDESSSQQPAFSVLQQVDLSGLEDFVFDAASTLVRYCELEQWPQALVRLGLHPQEASQMDAEKNLPLHVACRNGAPAIFLKTLSASYPEALTHQDDADGMTPLHITCGCNDVNLEKIQALLHYSPSVGQDECQSTDKDGDTPLHAAGRASAPLDVIKQLIDVYPRALHVRDQEGLTPLLRLWVRAFVMYGEENLSTIRSKYDFTEELQQIWEKTYVCLVGLSYGRSTLPDGIEFFMLHQAACYDCPRVVIEIALRLYPETIMKSEAFGGCVLGMVINRRLFRVRDLTDDVEDAVIVRSPGSINSEETTDEEKNNYDVEDDEFNVLYTRCPETGSIQRRLVPSVIELLLNAEPKLLNLCEQEGVSPLHAALRSGKSWTDGISAIVEHRPDSICELDPTTELWPFMMPAVCFAKRSTLTKINTTFELLRRAPHLVESGVPHCSTSTGTKRGHDLIEMDSTSPVRACPAMPSNSRKFLNNVEQDAYLVNPWSSDFDAKSRSGNAFERQDTTNEYNNEANPWLTETEEDNPWLNNDEEANPWLNGDDQ